MFTEAAGGGGQPPRYRLARSTALRREPFGAIAYSYESRRLRMIRSRVAAEVACRIDAGAGVPELVTWLAGHDPSRRELAARRVATAIDSLVASGVLVPDTDPS